MTAVRPVDVDLLREVEQFLFLEARLADEGDYDGWEALWADDGVYWIPANGDDIDPATQMSILYDNRSRIAQELLRGCADDVDLLSRREPQRELA